MSDKKTSRRYFGRWVRSYAADLDDQVRQALPDALYRTLDDLERLAGLTDGVLPDTPGIAFRLRLKAREVERRLAALVDVGLIVRHGHELRPRDWDDRQYETTSTARVQKHREKRKGGTHGNGDETFPPTFHATRDGVSASVSETERATPPQRRGNDPPNADETHTENQRSETDLSSSPGAVAARVIDDDDLLSKLKEASSGRLERGCANVAPIRHLIASGCDLEADILPFFRERVTKLNGPLRTFAAPWVSAEIRAFAEARKSAARSGGDPPQIARGGKFVSSDDPRWARLCARYRKERGGRPPPSSKISLALAGRRAGISAGLAHRRPAPGGRRMTSDRGPIDLRRISQRAPLRDYQRGRP